MWQYRTWILVLIVAMAGCAIRSPDPCRSNDWYTIGYQDGRAGRSSGAVDGPHGDCPEGLAEPELTQYRRGWEAGLGAYCEPQNGFQLGIAGHGYEGGCQGAGEAEFLRAYHQGKHIHDVEAQIRRLDSILAVNESERDRLAQSIQQRQTELAQVPRHVEAYEMLRAELRELEATAAMVEAEIDGLRAALREQHAQLALLRQSGDSR